MLHYPHRSAILVAGIPGAGKSTLLARAATASATTTTLDTDPRRERWSRHLGPIPYRIWRPLLHAAHYAAIWRGLAADATVLVAEPGTRPRLRRLFLRRARACGHTVHLVAIDASAAGARRGQEERRRTIRRGALERHARRWSAAKRSFRREGFDTVRVLSRADAARVRSIAAGARSDAPAARTARGRSGARRRSETPAGSSIAAGVRSDVLPRSDAPRVAA